MKATAKPYRSKFGQLLLYFAIFSLLLIPRLNAQVSDEEIAKERQRAQRETDSLWMLKSKTSQQKSLTGISPFAAYGSIEVHENATCAAYTPAQLVKNIFLKGGGCSSVENIAYRGHGWNGTAWTNTENRGLGYFHKGGTSVFEMEEGLVLSTGGLTSIAGPNSSNNGVVGPAGNVTLDADLQSLLSGAGQNVTNVSVLEFDFVPTGNTVQFRYIFASEEYANYVNSRYNDVFGFFISGPGISGKKNIAQLPGGNGVVSINNVNDGNRSYVNHNCSPGTGASNSAFYVNIPGSFSTCARPALSAKEVELQRSMQLNGRTVVLTATYTVTPCATYHLKFAVGNVGDQVFQSAVFLEARSFDSGDELLNFGNGIEGMDYLYRGCTNNKLRVTRPTADPFPIDVTLGYSTASAINGVDIKHSTTHGALPTFVTIPAGQKYVDVPYYVPNVSSGYKYLDVNIICPCDNSSLVKRLHIYDRSPDNIFQVSATPSCPGVNSGRISANIGSGGSGHYETSLNGITWQSSTLGYANLAPGNYTVYLRDEGSCYHVTRTITVGQAAVNAGANQSACVNTFTMGAAPLNTGETGTWSVISGAATITYPNNPTTPVNVTTSLAKLRWTLNTGVCVVTGDVTLTVHAKPVVPAIGGLSAVCVNNTITLTNTTTGGVWSSSNTGIATVSTGGIVTGKAAGAATITYTVTNAQGCSTAVSKAITVNALPVVNPLTGPNAVCINSTITLASTTTGGVWSSSNTGIATVSAGGIVTGKAAGAATITYTVTNAQGCSTAVSKAITVNALPVVNPLTGPNAVCVNSTITLASTTTGGVWSSSNTGIATVNTGGIVTGKAAGTATITYTVTNAQGCSTAVSKAITVNALPVVNPLTGPNAVCVNSTITLASTTTGGVWSSSNTGIATVNTGGVVTGKAAGTATITYTVTNAQGCSTAVSKAITVNALPVVNPLTGPNAVCVNSTITLASTTTGGVCSSSSTGVATVSATGIVTGKAAGAATITYTVTNAQGCSTAVSKAITVNALPVVSPLTGANAVCVNSTITLASTTTGGVWSSSNTGIATVSNVGVVTGKATGAATITYTVTNAQGCITAVSKSVTVNALPAITPIGGPTPMTVCIGGTLQLTNSTSGGTWSSGSTGVATITNTGVVTGVSAGTVTITYTVTNANGCSQSVTASATVMSNPILTISNASVVEGGNLEFTVTRTGVVCSPNNFKVSYTTINGTAIAPADYIAANSVLEFTSSETSKKIIVAAKADNIVEGSETMKVRLSSPVNCTLSGGGATLEATGTIQDGTDGTIIVEKFEPIPNDTPAAEPSTHGSFKIRFKNTAVTCVDDVKVTFSLSGAQPSKDYTITAAGNVLSATEAKIPKNVNHVVVPISIVNNYIVEGARKLEIKLEGVVRLP